MDLLRRTKGNPRPLYLSCRNLESDTFYARILFKIGDKVEEIDSRPSDAIALAVRIGVPIYVEEEVIKETTRFSRQSTIIARAKMESTVGLL